MSLSAPTVSAAEYRRGLLLVAGAMLIWSTAGILARLVDTSPWTTLFWRSIWAAGALLAYLAWRDGRRMFDGFARLGRVGVAMALCFGISMICFINALALTTVAAVLVFQAAAPLFAAGLAWLLLRERVGREKLIAIAVTMAGVGFMISDAGDLGRLWGNVISAGMGLTYAASVVLARARHDVPTTEATVLGVILVGIVSAPFAEFTVPAEEMALLAVFGVGQMGLALIMFTTGVRLIPSADAGLLSVLEAVAAPLWVWIALGENPGWRTLVGGAVVVAAVLVVAWREARAG